VTFPGWAGRVLYGIGVEPNHERVKFLNAWAACEGGTADFNPLNTTMPMEGARTYNSAGVREYADSIQGVAATILTLRLGYYRKLRQELAAPHRTARQIAVGSREAIHTWGTDPQCIIRRLGG
jgi:hypothetical protein